MYKTDCRQFTIVTITNVALYKISQIIFGWGFVICFIHFYMSAEPSSFEGKSGSLSRQVLWV